VRISQRVSRALATRSRGIGYSRGLGILSLAADALAEKREWALYQLITLSDALSALELEVCATCSVHARCVAGRAVRETTHGESGRHATRPQLHDTCMNVSRRPHLGHDYNAGP
jgi:hypothetical protein